MNDKYILAHELGTSSNKAVLTTVFGEIITTSQEKYPLYHPQPGFAEEEPLDWWQAICNTTRNILSQTNISPQNIAGVVLSSQVQNLIPIDSNGNPLSRSIHWLDGRSASIIQEYLWTSPRIMGYNILKLIKFLRITGGAPGHTGKDQIGKLLWLKRHQPEVFSQAKKFIDAKDFIIYKLTGKFVTSVDIAVIWWLLDTRNNKNQWHPELCQLAGITPDQLSEVKESSDIVGKITPEAEQLTGIPAGTPVINGAGDLAASAVGSGAIDEGELHINLGMSSWVAGHFSKRKIDLAHYAGCIGSAFPKKYYLGMAHQETACVCLEWLKNNVIYHEEQLKAEAHVSKIYELLDQLAAEAPPGANGLMFTPWMYGERCPIDDSYVRAGLYNLGLNHSRQHIIRAVLEGIAFNTRWAMETLENLYSPVSEINIIGGGARSDFWCQIIADITNRRINQIADSRLAGAKGMALLASATLGFIPSVLDIKKYIKIQQTYSPNPKNRKLYDKLFVEFKKIYKYNKPWYRRINGV